jgi:hypothetical protein
MWLLEKSLIRDSFKKLIKTQQKSGYDAILKQVEINAYISSCMKDLEAVGAHPKIPAVRVLRTAKGRVSFLWQTPLLPVAVFSSRK